MLVVVNQPHTNNNFRIEGSLEPSFIESMKNAFGSYITIEDQNDDDEYVNIEDTDWYKEMKAKETPSGNMRFYRRLCKMTQSELEEKLGTTKQHISNMERGLKPISKKTAKRLASIFSTSVASFI